MANELSKRFLEVLEYLIKEKKVADNKSFASQISVSTSMITEISKGRSNVGLTAIQNIVLRFPISADWLLTGEGPMLRTDGEPTMSPTPSTDISAPSDTVVLRLMDKIDEKDNIIKEKEAKIDQLQSELRQKSAELAALKAKYHEFQDKEPEPIIGLADAFTDKSSGDYGEGFLSTKKPTTSEKFSVGKI